MPGFRIIFFTMVSFCLSVFLSGCVSSPYSDYTPEAIGILPIEKTRLSQKNYRLFQEKSPVLLYVLSHVSFLKPNLTDQGLIEFIEQDEQMILRLALAKQDIRKLEAIHLWERDIKKGLLNIDEIKGFWQAEEFSAFNKKIKSNINRANLPET